MNKLLIIVLITLSTHLKAQDTAGNTLGHLVDRFYAALSEGDSAKRNTSLNDILAPQAEITSVIHGNGSARTTKGSLAQFLTNTRGFYRDYEVGYEELEREAEYYLDIASVHSICTQKLTEHASQKHYVQNLWLQLDCAFIGSEWKIVSATWSNETARISVENALLQDTLWHMEK